MYDTAPPPKSDGVRRLGGTVIGMPRDELIEWMTTEQWRHEPEAFIHGFADPDVIAGHGGIGLELLEDVPNLERVVVPVGGGGLISGIASALKGMRPEVEVVGVIGEDGFDPKKISRLTVLPDEHINEPFDLNDLVKMGESELGRTAEERNYFDHVMHFRMRTKDEQIEQANDLVSHALASSGLSDEARDAFTVAFREAMDNSARHGNKSNEDLCIDVHRNRCLLHPAPIVRGLV